jgi:hypothetical protein
MATQPAQTELPLPDPANEPCALCGGTQGVRPDGECWGCRRLVRCARDRGMGLCRAGVRAGGCVGAARCRAAGKRNFFDDVEVSK